MSWHLHRWTMWEVVAVTVHQGGRSVAADRNKRQCTRCGLTQTRGLW